MKAFTEDAAYIGNLCVELSYLLSRVDMAMVPVLALELGHREAEALRSLLPDDERDYQGQPNLVRSIHGVPVRLVEHPSRIALVINEEVPGDPS